MKLQNYWITGFVDGEGCFSFSIFRNEGMESGYQIQGEFTVVQHKRGYQVLHALKDHFGCGVVGVNKTSLTKGNILHYRVKNNDHLLQFIIPFFEKYSLCTTKKFELSIFKELCENIRDQKHLNPEGFEEMRLLVTQLSNIKKRVK